MLLPSITAPTARTTQAPIRTTTYSGWSLWLGLDAERSKKINAERNNQKQRGTQQESKKADPNASEMQQTQTPNADKSNGERTKQRKMNPPNRENTKSTKIPANHE